jgi:hypothetical protein
VEKTRRRPVVRSLFACGAIAASMLVLSPSPAGADVCTRREQPGVTITVGGTPVRIPTIYVEVCRDVSTTGLVPTPEVVTSGYGCSTNCLAIVLDYAYSSADQDVRVTYTIDGSGTSRTVTLPISSGDGSDFCVFGVGFPAPPVGGCYISIDPDF